MKKSDIASLTAIVKAIYPIVPVMEETAKSDLEDMFSNANVRPLFYVARIDNKIVGFIGLMESHKTFGSYELFWVMVHPESQRKGVGTKLTIFIIQKMKELGARYAELNTESPNYFEKFGFETIDKIDTEDIMSLKSF